MTEIGVNLDDVERAAGRLEGVANLTPVLTSRTVDGLVGASVFMKAECFQRTGSFKFRGAYNAISSLTADQRRRGVAAFSSGNHAQGVALAARILDVPATIVMPDDAPTAKVQATTGYGAEIVFYDRYRQNRETIAAELAAQRGLSLVPPFDDWSIIAGQGTAALELFDVVDDLDLLVVCVGGGGLISGCATVAAERGCRVVGVEPETGDDVRRSLAAGHIVSIDVPVTIADGQQTTAPGARTFAVIEHLVDGIELVSDTEIVDTMRFAFERLNVVLEPSGASALAAILSGKIDVAGRRVGVTLSGGNIDVARFTTLVSPVANGV